MQPLHQLQHVDLVGEVEEGGRLVEQQHVGALGQGHRDPHPLALPAGQRVDGSGRRDSAMPVQLQRLRHGVLVVGRPLPVPGLVRVPAARDQVGHGEALRRRPGPAAARRGPSRPRGSGVWSMRLPSSSTCPRRAGSSRPSARSSVDLPQPFGPMTAVTVPVDDVEVEAVDDDCVAVASWRSVARSRTASSPCFPGVPCVSSVMRDLPAVAGEQVSRYGAPSTAVTMPTGSSTAEHGAGDQVGRDQQQRAVDRRGEQRRPGRADQPLADLRGDQRDEADRARRGGGHRRQPDGREQQRTRGRG